MRVHLVGLLVAAGVVTFAGPALATPLFAVREGASCKSCHVNPSGGGMRNRYGRYIYGPTQLPAGYLRGSGSKAAPLDVDVSDSLSLGADARVAYIDQRSETGETDLHSIMAMQADLYVAATPFDGLTLYYDLGIHDSFELIGLYEFSLGRPAWSGYVKVGHYMPSYGLRLPNHRIFTREEIGFGPREKDTGAEVGAYLGPVHVQLGVVNGTGPEFKLDDNSDKGVVGRAELLVRRGDFRLMLGGSGYYNAAGTITGTGADVVDTRSWQTRLGVHVGAAFGRFAYLGEADVRKITVGDSNLFGDEEYSFRSYQELAVQIVRGVDLTLDYEFREPDLDVLSGRAHRLAAGFEIYPIPAVEFKVLYRRSLGSGPAEESTDGFNEVIAMIHMFY